MAFARRHLLALQALLISFLLLPNIFRSFNSTKVTWSVTELLINFQAGFVRRGLLGELLHGLCVHTGLSVFTVIGLLFLAATAFIVWAMTRLLQPYASRYPALTALLLFSPGLLMFPINEYAAYARKEVFIVIGLLIHALMARRFARGEVSITQMRRFYLLALLPLLTLFTFIHEVQLFFLPAHAGMMFLAAWQRRVNLQWLFLIYLVPAAAAMVLIRYPGNAVMIPGIVDSVRRELRRTQTPPPAVTLEITESHIMSDPGRTLPILHRLASLGVRLSIDDFGTGYSSLSHLRQFPVHEIKIDRSFIGTINNNDNRSIVKAVIAIAEGLDVETVAEGVEDGETAAQVAEMGCTRLQGYYIAKPMPAAQLTDWLIGQHLALEATRSVG